MNREEILAAAKKCVCGERDRDYGSPESNFSAIAEFWEIYINAKCALGEIRVEILPEDVAAMMVLFKMARVATGRAKDDNWIDAAGYCACGGEIEST